MVPPAEATVVEHLGDALPLDARFRDERGAPVRLGDYFVERRGRPVVLGFMYHRCAMLCSVVLDALVRALAELRWSVGVELDVITISIDPRDEPAVAEKKRAQVLARYGRPSAERGWHFLIGDEATIRRVTAAVGFGFRRDASSSAIAHPAAVMVVTPDARIARYLYGVEFAPGELERSLLAAADGRALSAGERLLLACWHVDDRATGNLPIARTLLRAGALGLLVALAVPLAGLIAKERRRRRLTE